MTLSSGGSIGGVANLCRYSLRKEKKYSGKAFPLCCIIYSSADSLWLGSFLIMCRIKSWKIIDNLLYNTVKPDLYDLPREQ